MNEPIYDAAAEQAVLGCLLDHGATHREVAGALGALRVAHFHVADHRRLWSAIQRLVDDRVPIEVATLPADLAAIVAELGGRGTVPVSLPHYLDKLEDAAQRRALWRACNSVREGLAAGDLEELQATLRHATEPIAGATPGPFAETWRTVAEWGDDGPDWLDRESTPAERTWLLKRPDPDHRPDDRAPSIGLFPLGKVGLLAAAGGVGKTMALCELALAVTTGAKWLGVLEVATTGNVLLALGEEDAAEFHRRLWSAADVMGLDDDQRREAGARIVALPLAGNPNMALTRELGKEPPEAPAAEELRRRLGGAEWSLIVLDPASRFAGPDVEKDNVAATRFVQVLETLAEAPGNPSVLVAHHTSQAARKERATDATVARGVTAFSDAVRWQATLTNRKRYDDAPDLVDFNVAKNNYARPWDGFTLKRDNEAGGVLREAGPSDLERHKEAERKAAIEAHVEKKILGNAKTKAVEAAAEVNPAQASSGAGLKGKL